MIVALAIAASVVVHVAVLAPVVVFDGAVREAPGAAAITVDLVTPQEMAPDSPPGTGGADTAAADTVKPEVQTAAQEAHQEEAHQEEAHQDVPQPAPAAADATPRALPQQPSPFALPPAFALPPPPLPVPAMPPLPPAPPEEAGESGAPAPLTVPDGIAGGRSFDREAVDRADVATDVAAAFWDHLRRCAKKPAEVPATARVVVRVYLQPDGSLVTGLPQNPAPLKVSRGGGELFVSAVAALRECQPYTMLPRDQYPEWRTLDLTFTSENF